MPRQVVPPEDGELKAFYVNLTAENWKTLYARGMELVRRAAEEGNETQGTLTDGFYLIMAEYFEMVNKTEGRDYVWEPPRPTGTGTVRKGFPRTR